MFHPGKVLEVLNPDSRFIKASDCSVQAIVKMWDENILTLNVAGGLENHIKKGSIVIIDYSPVSNHIAVPKYVIVKVIDEKFGKKIMEHYKKFYEQKKKNKENTEKFSRNPFAR